MAEPTSAHGLQLFSCTRLSARLPVRTCGARFLKVRAATKGSQDYCAACDGCPIGEHHARTGTPSPDVTTHTPAATAPTTTTPKETPTMAAKSEYTDTQKRDAAKRVLIDKEVPEAVGTELAVSGTTIRNWVKRFGTEVASDAMDAAAGKEPKPAKKQPPKKAAKRAAKEPGVPVAIISEEPARARPAPTPEVARIAQDLTEECKRLAPELGAAVRHIADRRVRAAVADAAWLLEELGAA